MAVYPDIQPVPNHGAMPQPTASMKVIASISESETDISQWKLRSDGSLELQSGPIPEASYFLKVCGSDGSCAKIPLQIAVCESHGEHAPQQLRRLVVKDECFCVL